MFGIEDYGSDNDSDVETRPTPSTSKHILSPKSSSLHLPPPTSTNSKSAGGLSLPPPRAKRPKKITIGLPDLSPEDGQTNGDKSPPAKKPRLQSGARSSALLSMLPAPKNKAVPVVIPERVLGGGRGPGLVFNTASGRSTRSTTVEDAEDDGEEQAGVALDNSKPSISFLPPSLAKGKANVSVEEQNERPTRIIPSATPALDFFSLGSSSSATVLPSAGTPATSLQVRLPAPPVASSSASTTTVLPGISSAPKVDDFVPPDPTPQDPYPGYYLLPSGSWAAYDPEYYHKFYDKWKREYDAHVRALEKGTAKGFEAVDTEGAQEFNALREMEKAKIEIQEREERKALTTAGADVSAAPKMNVKGAALGGRARTRHQLATLLTEAYQNRESLEEKIAQGRRNRKEAGNKYGEARMFTCVAIFLRKS
ncbi:uncharacterized protein FIBRA_04514 [Fibroporia radiculosa]|uniref:Mitotic checkpoint regulator, MAD2B-interacting-domain-containing protein n=1 Tax=Fibroporia radiculosa TaxID=599839 RepID=J4IA74_9APHY|nr:uncharacterized protein FIBRA_04514 [Fibroporia radiculosa]CCM02416.1 predicted protein [Fibroporia radiculosa]